MNVKPDKLPERTVTVRLREELLQVLKRQAIAEDRSVSQLLRRTMEERFAPKDTKGRMKPTTTKSVLCDESARELES